MALLLLPSTALQPPFLPPQLPASRLLADNTWQVTEVIPKDPICTCKFGGNVGPRGHLSWKETTEWESDPFSWTETCQEAEVEKG